MVHQTLLVGHDDDRRPQRVDALEQGHDLQRAVRVEVAGRLVGDDRAGVVDKGAGDGDALLLAAGELVRIALPFPGQTDQIEHIGDAVFDLARARADGAHREAQVVVHRFLADQAEILKNYADRAAHVGDLLVRDAAHGEAVDHDAALRGKDLAGQELDDGGLAGAGRADEEHELPVLYRKGDPAQGLRSVVVCLDDVF